MIAARLARWLRQRRAKQALSRIRKSARENGTATLTFDEIAAEIKDARRERKLLEQNEAT